VFFQLFPAHTRANLSLRRTGPLILNPVLDESSIQVLLNTSVQIRIHGLGGDFSTQRNPLQYGLTRLVRRREMFQLIPLAPVTVGRDVSAQGRYVLLAILISAMRWNIPFFIKHGPEQIWGHT
jgi:hypothetical protein